MFAIVGDRGGRRGGGFEIGDVVVVNGEGDDMGANSAPPERRWERMMREMVIMK